jgi:hypothetical protein
MVPPPTPLLLATKIQPATGLPAGEAGLRPHSLRPGDGEKRTVTAVPEIELDARNYASAASRARLGTS